MTSPKRQRPQALNEWVYDQLKSMICSTSIKPGEQINIEHIAEEMGVSRTPVREALLRLQQDGLVRSVSRVGYFCTSITKRDIREMFELREMLEAFAARKATTNLSDEDLTHLRQSFEPLSLEIADGQYQNFLDSEIQFHTLLVNRASNRKILEVMNALYDHMLRVRILSLFSHEHVVQSFDEHMVILDALERRDAVAAEAAMAHHMRQVKERMLSFLDVPDGNDQEP